MSPQLRSGWVESLTHEFLAWVAVVIFGGLVALAIALAFLFISQPSLAQVRVPQDCIDLAMKYGRPMPATMSRFRASQVKAELKLLSDDEPMVKKCRDAVAKLEGKK